MRALRTTTLALVPALLAVACGGEAPPPVQAPVMVAVAPSAVLVARPSPFHGVVEPAMDRTVRPGADFYRFANGSWLSAAVIPEDRSSTGPGLHMREVVEGRLKAILEESAAAGAPAGTGTQRIGDAYASFMDEAGIEAKGLAPIQPMLDRIAHLKTKRDLAAFLGSELRADVDPINATHFHTDRVLGLWVEQDLDDPSQVAPYLLQGGLGMPDRSYYLDDTAPMKAVRETYVVYLTSLLGLAHVAGAEAKAKRILAFETALAKTHATRTESQDVKGADNAWTQKDFAVRAPGLDWSAYFKAARLDAAPKIIVWHPTAVTGLAAAVGHATLADWKDYLTVRALGRAAPLLPKAFVDVDFAFFGTAVSGTPKPRERWKIAEDVVSGLVGDALGKVYVERHFPAESKREIQTMVDGVMAAFGRRVDGLAWMSAGTKAKAKAKLATLRVGIGYPDAWRDDTGLVIVRGDALGNAQRAAEFEYARALAKIGKPADRGEWVMEPQVVNAVNLPIRNALNFPAAILQAPTYDPEATAAVKFAAIGAIIGHEISHSFDDKGSLFDADGKLSSWWTPDDLAHFHAAGDALVKQYDGYRPFPDLAVNGKQCLSEDIADLAGLTAAYDAWKTSLHGEPAPVVGGLTGDQQFFIGFAQNWQSKIREATLRSRIATDGHAPPEFRALTVRNLDAWYAAFDVKPSDPLYLAPEARVRVW